MNVAEIAAYLARGRVVDLSKKVMPGQAEGPLATGKRRYNLKPFSYPPGELMHYIDMESHISTHVEAPSHFVPVAHPGTSAPDVSEVALSHFFGVATLVDCNNLPPKTAIGRAVLEKFNIQENDIVLIGRCPHSFENACYLVKEGVEYLLAKKVKLVGVDDTVFPEDPQLERTLQNYTTHDLLLSNGIPLIEALANLAELLKPRFLFFAFPAKMGGLESFPIRAVAVEGAD
jgi:arylformamidase